MFAKNREKGVSDYYGNCSMQMENTLSVPVSLDEVEKTKIDGIRTEFHLQEVNLNM